MSALTFFRQFLTQPHTVGAVLPSSIHLARVMAEAVDLPAARSVAEFGPGTGAFTGEVLRRLPAGCTFFAVELNPDLASILTQRHPGVRVHVRSIGDIADILKTEGLTGLDAVVCGLPWTSFPEPLQRELLAATLDAMNPGGRFATFTYSFTGMVPAGRRFRRMLRQHFKSVEATPIVWRNVPPAFVLRCVK